MSGASHHRARALLGAVLGLSLFAGSAGLAQSAAAPAQPATPPTPSVANLRQFDAALRGLLARDEFSGVVLVARGDTVRFARAYGFASREYGARNALDTRFNLASAGKMFTATAIMMLAERGRLSVDDPIGRHLGADWIADARIRERVTIAHLLSHTSGFGNYLEEAFYAGPRIRFVELADYKPIIADSTLSFEPGTRWQYSNTGYLLLGAIVEAASGSDYHAFLQANIFDRLGMTRTGAVDLQQVVPGFAQGYTRVVPPTSPPPPGQPAVTPEDLMRTSGPWRNNVLISVVKGGPAGGLYSTAPDLLRFVNALAAGRLVSAGTLQRMTTPKPASPTYGYAMRLNDGGAGHGGAFPGVSTNIRFYPDGTRFIVLSNVDRGAVAPFEIFKTLPDLAP